ncbi:MAG: MBL fold metallo-hydrolase [Rhodothermales bacterium]|nr:MBL fold metallo-hydrolase [Rhodothermales bacterium]
MKLTFWGAARTVTGSKHLLELENGKRILLDCGLFQGRRADAETQNRQFGFDPTTIDVVLLSHAHIDHAGLLPKLYRDGFRGRVYATHATYDLASLLLYDSAHIQEKDVEFVNRIRSRKGQEPVEALYDDDDVEGILGRFVTVSYGDPFSPCEGVQVVYRDAGHILGSATMVLTLQDRGKTIRLGFTGDVGSPGRPILRDPQPMDACDYLISESTYGGMVHEGEEHARGRLAGIVERTAKRGGKLIIPAFAVGRTQEIVYALDQLQNEKKLPPIPVYVDSPLAVNATGVFMAHPECFDRELRQYMRDDPNPFGFENLTYIRDVRDSKALNDTRMPMVIISASGMCEAGRVLHHLRNNIEDPRTTILIVGFCAEHTLGKKLVDKLPEVRIFGEDYHLRAEVVVINAYSAHADEPGLLEVIGAQDKSRLKKIFLVHGAPERQDAFKASLLQRGYHDVTVPEHGESFEIT